MACFDVFFTVIRYRAAKSFRSADLFEGLAIGAGKVPSVRFQRATRTFAHVGGVVLNKSLY